jgi:glutamine synthetase
MITGWSFTPLRSRSSFPSFEKGEVFTADILETWIIYKRKQEIDPLRLRPHPYESLLYYDA